MTDTMEPTKETFSYFSEILEAKIDFRVTPHVGSRFRYAGAPKRASCLSDFATFQAKECEGERKIFDFRLENLRENVFLNSVFTKSFINEKHVSCPNLNSKTCFA